MRKSRPSLSHRHHHYHHPHGGGRFSAAKASCWSVNVSWRHRHPRCSGQYQPDASSSRKIRSMGNKSINQCFIQQSITKLSRFLCWPFVPKCWNHSHQHWSTLIKLILLLILCPPPCQMWVRERCRMVTGGKSEIGPVQKPSRNLKPTSISVAKPKLIRHCRQTFHLLLLATLFWLGRLNNDKMEQLGLSL